MNYDINQHKDILGALKDFFFFFTVEYIMNGCTFRI